MKQVTQRLRDGRIEVREVPEPELRPEGVLVQLRASLISTGTERSTVETARQNLIGKARSRPDQVRQVVDAMKRDGVVDTVRAVRTRLDQPSALGYSASGVAMAVGSRVSDILPGDRVACGGGGYASHAEVDYVPGNLCVRVPAALSFDQAAFATIGAVALHGVRQADARLGERVAVIGLGLVGQLTGLILRAAGCDVVGIDLAPALVERAVSSGAVSAGFVRGALDGGPPERAIACDAVIVTAATSSADPVELAARLARDRARVVIVGDVRMDVPRGPYYAKELEVRMSRSYGPGRYDPVYEEQGVDYPIGYVRWTERRNMEAFLELVGQGKVCVDSLVTESAPVDEAAEVYERLLARERPPLALLLRYEGHVEPAVSRVPERPPRPSGVATGVIGSGGFATRVLIPGMQAAGFTLRAVASSRGLSARAAADQFGFGRAGSPEDILRDPDVDVVAIATRHGSHARLAVEALDRGKAVFVEKPPCLTRAELEELRGARSRSGRLLAVGFNRRHAPLTVKLRQHVRRPGLPLELLYRVNAGLLPSEHWVNDPEEGGGRLLGEGCHFVDFACSFVGALPNRISCTLRAAAGQPLAAGQSFSITLAFEDGSVATILYAADGATSLGKEYVEAHAGGRSGILDDYRLLELHGGGRRQTEKARAGDKGHQAQFAAFRAAVTGAVPLGGLDPLATMGATLAALESAERGSEVVLEPLTA